MFLLLLLMVGAPVDAAEERDAESSNPPPTVIRNGGIGTIQRIQGDDVVIDDRLYRLAPDTQYVTSGGESTWKSSFQPADRVIFELDSVKEIRLLRQLGH